MPTCHGILGIPDPEMYTCGILGTLGCGTLRTLDPEIYTCHGTLGTQDPRMYTWRGTLGTLDPEGYTGRGTLETQDPEMYTWHGTLGTQDPEMYTWRGTLGTQDPELYTWCGTLRILDLDFLPWHMSDLNFEDAPHSYRAAALWKFSYFRDHPVTWLSQLKSIVEVDSPFKRTVPARKRLSNILKRLRKIFAMPVRPRSSNGNPIQHYISAINSSFKTWW